MKFNIFFLLFIMCLLACGTSKIPKEKLNQFPPNSLNASYTLEEKKINIYLRNGLLSPVRFKITTKDTFILNHLKENNPMVLKSEMDTTIQILLPENYDPEITFSSALGDPAQEVDLKKVSLPIKKNTPVEIIQGYNGSYSHNSTYSRYAIDFNIKENDTVFAATDGVVIGMIKDYIHGGPSGEWKGYDNFITIYDPVSGLFTQYVHLVHQGSLVKIGEKVKQGDPIGLSGKTGFAGMPHLHFNTLVPVKDGGLVSVPVEFIEGYKGKDLRRNQRVIKLE